MNWKRFLRKTHRWLGLLIGIQFLAWTIGGLYFSWTDLDDIHGDDLRKPPPALPVGFPAVSPDEVLRSIGTIEPIREVQQIVIIPGPDGPLYRIHYTTGEPGEAPVRKIRLAETGDGRLREPLDQEEARSMALEQYAGEGGLVDSLRLEKTGSHHEYRGGPLPAWVFSFDDPGRTRIYVSAERATIATLRHRPWRIFDFLWMLHTMDYAGRDNFNNWLIRAFSLFGLATITSGFILFIATSPMINRRGREGPA